MSINNTNLYINGKQVQTEQISNKTYCSIIDFITALGGDYGQTSSTTSTTGYRYSASATDSAKNEITATVNPDFHAGKIDTTINITRYKEGTGKFPGYSTYARYKIRNGSKWNVPFGNGFDFMVEFSDLCTKTRECGFTVKQS